MEVPLMDYTVGDKVETLGGEVEIVATPQDSGPQNFDVDEGMVKVQTEDGHLYTVSGKVENAWFGVY